MNDAEKNVYLKTMNLNLEDVKNKFLSKKSRLWKLKNNVNKIENQYRQFLFLAGTSTSKVVPWSQDVDDFWHEHILNTRKYEKDCLDLFSKFVHHDPNLPKGTTNHTLAFEQTKILYRDTFKEQIKSSKTKKSSRNYSSRRNDREEPDFVPVFVGCASCGSVAQTPATPEIRSDSSVNVTAEPDSKSAWESVTDFISDNFSSSSSDSGSSDSGSSGGGSSCSSSSCSSSSCSSSSCGGGGCSS